MSLWMLPPKGAITFNLVGINPRALMPLGDLKTLGMSLSQEASTPPNKADLPHHTPTNPKRGDIRSSPAKWAKIPNRGCINKWTNFISECLMVALGYTETNILIIKIPRTHLHQRNCLYWKPLSCRICQNWRMTPLGTILLGHRSRSRFQQTFPSLMGRLGKTLPTISPHTIYGASPIHFWMTRLSCGYFLGC